MGTLLDCHSNWCATASLFYKQPDQKFPLTVTADFHVKLNRPTPFGIELFVKAKAAEIDGQKVIVEATVLAEDKINAMCRATCIAVEEGHPAFDGWLGIYKIRKINS